MEKRDSSSVKHMEIYCHACADQMLFVLGVFYFVTEDYDFTRLFFFSGKLIQAAAGPTADSLFFGHVEIASGKLILETVGPTDLLLKKLISTPRNGYKLVKTRFKKKKKICEQP